MADISIQFHALPEELLAFVRQVVAEFDLRVVALRYRPFRARELAEDQLADCFADDSPDRRLHFSLGEPALAVARELEFGDKNPDSLRLDVGVVDSNGVRESWLSARTDNSAALAVWRQVAKRLKGITEQGATAISPKTGGRGPARSHRFSAGAKRLEAAGTPMLTITGVIMKPGLPGAASPPDASP